MAVVAVKSNIITKADATPPTIMSPTERGGKMRQQIATVEVTNGDSIASIFRMVRLPSNARVCSIWLYNDAITSATADIGIYQTAANGGAVVDVDAYATALAISSARTVSPVDASFEARDIANAARKVWEDAGLTADTQREYDLAFTLTAAATATGTVTWMVDYVVD